MSLNDSTVSTMQDEGHRFSASIETTLQQKIIELQASEDMRLQLSRQVNNLKNQLALYHKTEMMVSQYQSLRQP